MENLACKKDRPHSPYQFTPAHHTSQFAVALGSQESLPPPPTSLRPQLPAQLFGDSQEAAQVKQYKSERTNGAINRPRGDRPLPLVSSF